MKNFLFPLLFWSACASVPKVGDPAAKTRLQAFGELGAVATANPHASAAALEILRRGGTAADAAIAAALVLGVTEPYSAGLGGGGFALVHDAAAGSQHALDFRERAPAAALATMYQDKAGKHQRELSLNGWLAVAVPGTPAGLEALYRLKLEGRGSLPFEQLVLPAMRLAAEGFVVTPLLAARIAARRDALAKDPESSRLFLPAGRALQSGARLVQSDLAETLARYAELGANDWRQGLTAQRIAAAIDAGGGIVSESDFASYRVKWRQPLSGSYRGHTVVSFPPPSSGGLHLLQMLALIERGERPSDATGPAAVHRRIEIMRRAYQDRARHLGDPDFYPVPVAGLLSEKHLDALNASIGASATPSSELNNPQPEAGPEAGAAVSSESDSTTHLSVIDRYGNAVSMTFTINYGFGAAVMAPGTGVLLNDEMDDFSAAPGQANAYGLIGGKANAIVGGKTPLSSMSPTLLLNSQDQLRLVIGSPGGPTIITTVLQILLHIIDGEMNLAQAIAQPRLHHQWMPDCVIFDEGKLPGGLISDLKSLGHCLKGRSSIGNAQGVLVRKDGRLEAAADPRGEGLALALEASKEEHAKP
jgi:gamma-glutamyltranspeptidase/glutathione hydrolase